MKLSVVIPVFDEARTVKRVIERVVAALLASSAVEGAFEIIAVDDGSSDGSAEILAATARELPQLRLLSLPKNRGKGAAVAHGVRETRGEVVVIQDADGEYDPRDLERLLAPIFEGHADVVFGSRFRGEASRVLYFHHYLANRMITFLSNACTNLNLTDIETGYKAFRGDLVRGLALESERFGIEPEVTAKVARIPHVRVYEVGISYFGRTYEEGKKVTWRDGVAALYWVARYNLSAALEKRR